MLGVARMLTYVNGIGQGRKELQAKMRYQKVGGKPKREN
jgi:hypothetical protein